MSTFQCLVAAIVGVLALPGAFAHELDDNRATLVLRDRGHLSMTLRVRYSEAIRRAVAPDKSLGEFVLACAVMKPDDLRTLLRRVQEKLQAGTRLILNGNVTVPIVSWSWPDAIRVQDSCRRQVMKATVGGAAHDHEDDPIEIRGDVTYDRTIETANVRFADELGSVLLVWYRPKQTWLDARQQSPPLRFP